MTEKRKNWNDLISGFRASDLVFLDESGCNTDMTRRYADSFGGSRAVDSTPLSKPKNTTILSSIQLDRTLHDTTFSGGTTVEHFKHYLKDILLPHLNGNSVLVMDNMKSHHAMQDMYRRIADAEANGDAVKSKVCFFQRDRQLHGFAAAGLSQSFQVSIRSSISDVNRRSR